MAQIISKAFNVPYSEHFSYFLIMKISLGWNQHQHRNVLSAIFLFQNLKIGVFLIQRFILL